MWCHIVLTFLISLFAFLVSLTSTGPWTVFGGSRLGWTTAAKVQSQTQRFRNQDAKGGHVGKGQGSGWLQKTWTHVLGIGDRVQQACRVSWAAQWRLVGPRRSWQDSTLLSRLPSCGCLQPDWPPGHPHTRPPAPAPVPSVLSAHYTPFLCPNPTVFCLANLYASFKQNLFCLLPHR